MLPERRGAVRGLGARRFDRGQPAQVAVHAARRVAAADAPHGRAAGGVQPRARSTCGRSTGRRRSTTTTSTRRSSAGGSGRSSCGCSCAGSGSRGCAAGSAQHLEHGRRRSRPGSTPIPTGSAWRRSRSRPSASAGTRAAGPGPTSALDDAQRRDHGRRQPDRRGLPLAHAARRPVHDPASSIGNLRTEARHVERAWALLREAARGRSRRVKLDAAATSGSSRRAEELRDWFDANHATADELWLGYHRKATGRPSVDWSQAVDEALCVGWIDGVRYGIDEDVVSRSGSRRAEGQHLERHQRRQGRRAARPRAGCGRPVWPRSRRGRRADRRSTRTSGRTPTFSDEETARFRADAAAWADWERGRRRTAGRSRTG